MIIITAIYVFEYFKNETHDVYSFFRLSRSDPKPVWMKGEVVDRVSTRRRYIGVGNI